MIEQYTLFENLQKAKKFLADNKISETDERFVKLRDMLKNNLGYMAAFTKWMYKDRESFERLEDVFKKLTSISNLDRQVDEFKKMEDLYDYLQEFEINRKVKQVLKSLPSRTRELANDELKNLIKLNADDKTIGILKFGGKKICHGFKFSGFIFFNNIPASFRNIVKTCNGFFEYFQLIFSAF